MHEAKTKGDVDKAYLRMTSYSTSSVDYGYWWIELPGKTEDMLCTFDELVATVVELGASGIIINALGISHYMSVKTLEAL